MSVWKTSNLEGASVLRRASSCGSTRITSPFTDINPQGPEAVFTSEQVDDLIALLLEIRERAAA
jgi:hypothetical protein